MLLRALLCLFLVAGLAIADDGSRSNVTRDVVTTTTTISVGATIVRTVEIGSSEIQGICWYITSAASVNVELQFRHSNSYSGPYDYAGSINSSPTTTRTTVTDGTNCTDLWLCPSKYVQVSFVNNGGASAVVRSCSMFTY